MMNRTSLFALFEEGKETNRFYYNFFLFAKSSLRYHSNFGSFIFRMPSILCSFTYKVFIRFIFVFNMFYEFI